MLSKGFVHFDLLQLLPGRGPMKHASGIIFHLCLFKVKVFGLVIGNSYFHAFSIAFLNCCFVCWPENRIDNFNKAKLF